MRKISYDDVLSMKWRVIGIYKADSVCVYAGKIPVVAGIAKAYAEHIVSLHNEAIGYQEEV